MGSQIKGRENLKHYFFYKTTNNLNGNYYYGVHSTNNLEDGYLGSGLLLTKAIDKYGRDNFSREIIRYFDNMQEALDYERSVVNDNLLKDPKCYNIRQGGYGGCFEGSVMIRKGNESHTVSRAKLDQFLAKGWEKGGLPRTEEVKKLISEKLKGREVSEKTRQKIRENKLGKPSVRKGMKASEETCKKIGNASRDTCYIHEISTGKNKRIKKSELENFLGTGNWLRGRNENTSQILSLKGKGRILIHNSQGESRKVSLEALENFLSLGWKKGRPEPEEQSRLVRKGNRFLRVLEKDLDNYLQDGWEVKGTTAGKVQMVRVENPNEKCRVDKDRVDTLLKEGWVLSRDFYRELKKKRYEEWKILKKSM